jgi:hypothetical protein
VAQPASPRTAHARQIVHSPLELLQFFGKRRVKQQVFWSATHNSIFDKHIGD